MIKYEGESRSLIFNDEDPGETWPTVRRYKGGTWERLMGQSWEDESSSYDDKLEKEYQKLVALGQCPDIDKCTD